MKTSEAELLAGLLEVQIALACARDGQKYVHPVHGELDLEELKYCVVDPLCGNDDDAEDERRANARLAAAAMDLYETGRNALNALRQMHSDALAGRPVVLDRGVHDALEAAIAKAGK